VADEQELTATVRAVLAGTGNIREVRMFGGIGFMLNGNMVAAASRRGLLLRVGKDRQAEALAQSGARPMVMRGRTMEGYVYADPPALNKPAIENWLRLAVAYVQILPPKTDKKPKQRKDKRK
jgi:TfoX/Sxy family transcriptional regulator of competence genes